MLTKMAIGHDVSCIDDQYFCLFYSLKLPEVYGSAFVCVKCLEEILGEVIPAMAPELIFYCYAFKGRTSNLLPVNIDQQVVSGIKM